MPSRAARAAPVDSAFDIERQQPSTADHATILAPLDSKLTKTVRRKARANPLDPCNDLIARLRLSIRDEAHQLGVSEDSFEGIYVARDYWSHPQPLALNNHFHIVAGRAPGSNNGGRLSERIDRPRVSSQV